MKRKFNNDLILSFRQIAAQLNIHHTTCEISEKDLRMFPCKLLHTLSMRSRDTTSFLAFVEKLRSKLATNRKFLELIMFSDENRFSIAGKVKKKPCRVWRAEHSNQVHDLPQHSPPLRSAAQYLNMK